MRFKCVLLSLLVGFLAAGQLCAEPIAGSSSGIFANPVGGPENPGMVVTGVGTNHFTWGIGVSSPPSSLTFTGTAYSGNTEQVLSFGTLDYFNGAIQSGTGASAVDLQITLSFTLPPGITQAFTYNLTLVNTPNVSDPNLAADYVYLPTAFPDATFTVGGVVYTLEIVGFGLLSGGGFTTFDSFHVFEGSRASAQLLGRVTSHIPTIPEPATVLLLGAGLAGLGLRMRRNRK